MTRDDIRPAPAAPGGSAFASLLVSALGLTLVVPGLLLPSVVTRSRERVTDETTDPGADETVGAPPPEPRADAGTGPEPLSVEVDPSLRNGDRPADGHAALLAAATANAEAGTQLAPTAVDSDATDDRAGRRARRVRANPSARRQRAASGDEPDAVSPAGSDQEASAQVPLAGQPGAEPEGTEPANGAVTDEAAAEGETDNKQQRQVKRLQKRQQAKAERREQTKATAGLPAVTFEEGQAAHAAMVRHLSVLTTNLNEAHRIIGRLNMEKYQAQKELAIAKKLPLPPPPPDPTWAGGQRSGEPRAVRQLQRNKQQEVEEFDPELVAHAKQVARRRQMIFAVAVTVLAAGIIGYQQTGWTWFPDITDREALTQIAGIGVFVQLFFVGWIVYRIARVGGKGARWLFPSVEEEQRKMRRKGR